MAVPGELHAPAHCSVAELLTRGWTPYLVRTLLGDPDRTEPVPLYLAPRVAAAEAGDAFGRAVAVRRRRADALRAATGRRRELAMEAVRSVPLDLPELPAGELAARAVRHRNLRDAHRAARSWGHRPRPVTVGGSSAAELARWEVDYLCDLLAGHRRLLEALPPGTAREEGDRLLRRRMSDAIIAAYPGLQRECRRRLPAARAG
ncbi:hypothetical protein PJ985_13160 [Streptomyces sp. ACA25]|uniref:hypothetical protein n=1 Tax=Streptomyces sp. ACA25 TaxID=3022596 RepID=UPI00230749AA|nr:hypothetical protein [Streptomyces sp. ACA25]MDB1088516.1 hypothetical protein [Streptomyces sp. ACA25]